MFSRRHLKKLLENEVYPAFLHERDRLDDIDKWARWEHETPISAVAATREHKELSERATTPLGRLIVNSVVQEMYVDGYRRPDAPDNQDAWRYWQANGLDSRQLAVHRTALSFGEAYVQVMPGETTLGEQIPVIRGFSPREMIAFWDDLAWDDWPVFVARFVPAKFGMSEGYNVTIVDDTTKYLFTFGERGQSFEYVTESDHGIGVCPVVRFANDLDLEGRQSGDVEPFVPVLGRIDQTVYDRLLVQRHASWVTKTISGLTMPDDDEVAHRTKLRLSVDDLLIGEDPDTKFGSIPASSLDGIIKATQTDLQMLAAVSQTPAYELSGDLINLSADALVAARVSLQRRIDERRQTFGRSWEQALRLASRVMGDSEAAQAWDAQVRWRDTEGRSLAQAADALGKLAAMLNVPVEMLWERIPGWTQQDVSRAKQLSEDNDVLVNFISELNKDMGAGSGVNS